MSGVPTVIAAAAAAILTTKHLTDEQRSRLEDQRYFVHPHIARLSSDDRALISYLEDIYSWERKAPIDASTPQGLNGEVFKRLADPVNVAAATAEIADCLQAAMEPKAAKPGILFGFALELDDDQNGYGFIKADLEDDQRFFLKIGSNNTWSLSQVQDILPPPQTKFAKYAISPRPRQPGAVGIRDTQAEPDSAADYFLEAVGLVVPRRSGTKRAVAHAAKRSGYEDRYIREVLSDIKTDTPTTDVIEQSFVDIPGDRRERLRGTTERPMDIVVANDPYYRKYYTNNPRFELIVDESINVRIEGRTIIVELPATADIVDHKYIR